MRYNSKKGFSLAEALVGFSLFSIILMLYLPAFYSEIERMSQLKMETEHWRIFYELVQVNSQQMTAEQSPLETSNIYPDKVSSFHCDATACSISFMDGSAYDVSLLDVTL